MDSPLCLREVVSPYLSVQSSQSTEMDSPLHPRVVDSSLFAQSFPLKDLLLVVKIPIIFFNGPDTNHLYVLH